MFLTTFAGVALLFAAVQHARTRRNAVLVRELSWLVALTSGFGFVAGVVLTFTHVGGCDPRDLPAIALAGIGESLTNPALGLLVLAIARVIKALGATRSDAELADPHAK